MLLGDSEILARIKQGGLIKPFKEQNLQPASYDLTLGGEFLFPRPDILELGKEPVYCRSTVGYCVLTPGGFCLATTVEQINLPLDLVGRVEGRSSLGRLGLAVHVTAGFIDPGFQGQITLEIVNHGPNTIRLLSGIRIAQIAFEVVHGCTKGYTGKYQGQKGVVGSKIFMDAEVSKP